MPSLASARCRVAADLRRLYPHIAEWATEKKTRGRHDGCIHIDAAASEDDPNRHIMFEKQQRLCIRTIFVYRVLARIGCGPQHTRFYPYRGSASAYELMNSVLTSRVPGFKMVSDWSFSDSPLSLPIEDVMLLALLIVCFDLADLPRNRDNWGSQPGSPTGNGTNAHQHAESDVSTVTPPEANRLAIVDFSFGDGLVSPIHRLRFVKVFTEVIEACDPLYERPVPRRTELKKRFLSAYGKWFSSRKAFARLLDLAASEVNEWLDDHAYNERDGDHKWMRYQSVDWSKGQIIYIRKCRTMALTLFQQFQSHVIDPLIQVDPHTDRDSESESESDSESQSVTAPVSDPRVNAQVPVTVTYRHETVTSPVTHQSQSQCQCHCHLDAATVTESDPSDSDPDSDRPASAPAVMATSTTRTRQEDESCIETTLTYTAATTQVSEPNIVIGDAHNVNSVTKSMDALVIEDEWENSEKSIAWNFPSQSQVAIDLS